jgi:hypothetical protein
LNIVKTKQIFGLNLVYSKLKGLNFGKPIQLHIVYGKRLTVNYFCGMSLGLSSAYFGFRLFKPPRLIDKDAVGVFKKIPNEPFLFFSNLTPKLSILPRMLLKLSLNISNFRVLLISYRQRFVFKKKKIKVLFRVNKTSFYFKKLEFKLRGSYRRVTRFIYRHRGTKFLLLSRLMFSLITISTKYEPIPITNNLLWRKHKLGYDIFLNWRSLSRKNFFCPSSFKLLLKQNLFSGFFHSFFTRSVFSALCNVYSFFGVFSKNLKKSNIGSSFNYLVIRFLNRRAKDNLLTRVFGFFSFSGYSFLTRGVNMRKRYSSKPIKVYFKQRIILFKMFKTFWSFKKVYKVKNAIGKLNKIRYFRVNNFVKRFILRLDLVVANFFCTSSLMSFVLIKFGYFKINGLRAKKHFQFIKKFDAFTVQTSVIGWLDILKTLIRKRKLFKRSLSWKKKKRKFKKLSLWRKFRLWKLSNLRYKKYVSWLKPLGGEKVLMFSGKDRTLSQYKSFFGEIYSKNSKKIVSTGVFNKFYGYVDFFKNKIRRRRKRKLILKKKKNFIKYQNT